MSSSIIARNSQLFTKVVKSTHTYEVMTSSIARFSNSTLFTKVKSIPVQYPFGFGVVLSGFKTSFSDLLVQKVIEKREDIDWKRNSAFAAFGFIYLGGVQYMLYVPLFGRLFPTAATFASKPLSQKIQDVPGMLNLVAQVFLDQCVHHPLMYFPAFYCTKELVMNTQNPNFTKVLTDYKNNLTDDLKALWKIWVPATLVNFAFMPMYARIPFVAGVSLLWTCVLSATRGGDIVNGTEMVGGAVTGATYSLLKEGLDERFNITPVELDTNMCHVSLSAAGKQKPGLVAELARKIANFNGNITHSKMVRLGQEFIIQMHVAIPPEQKNNFLKALKTDKYLRDSFNNNIQTTILTRRDTKNGTVPKAVLGIHLYCIGEDRYVRVKEKGVDQGIRKLVLYSRESKLMTSFLSLIFALFPDQGC